MNNIYKDILIDGKQSLDTFHGIGLVIDKNMLRRLIVYKDKFPESYKKINDLLFRKKSGMAFSHLRFTTNHEKATDYAADIMQINSDISAECSDNNFERFNYNFPQYSILADGNGLSGEGSIIDGAEKIIKKLSSIVYFDGESALNIESSCRGEFKATPLLWSIAHITYFSEIGWSYAVNDPDNNYISLVSDAGDFSIIFVNNSPTPKKYRVCLKNILKSDRPVHCVETKGPSNSDAFCSNWFRVVDKMLPFEKDGNDCYNIEIKPFSVMTCTTLNVDNINGTDTFEYFYEPEEIDETNNFDLSSDNSLLPIWDVSGEFEEYSENETTYIEQTEISWDIISGETACTLLGDELLSAHHLTVLAEFSDDDPKNFVGIGICCDKNGNIGYGMKIHPDGVYEVYDCGRVSDIDVSTKISAASKNCLEIIIDDKKIIYKLNDEEISSREINEIPSMLSGYGMLMSGYRRNTFSNVKITQSGINDLICNSHDCLCGDFEYTDSWIKNGNADTIFTHRTCVSTDKENQSFEFEFIGKKIAFFGKTENLRIKVEIDGAITIAGKASDRDCNVNEAFYIKDDLENTIHILKLTVLSGKLEFDKAQTYCLPQKKLPKAVRKIHKHKQKTKPLKKSTILIGAGIAIAGAGIFFIKKKLNNRKKERK